MENDAIAVIVPVYNTEPYLHPCIQSILKQTHRNLEVILIDDGSTDQSGAMCDDFAEKDSRVRVIHQDNQGLSAARNNGLDCSVSPYVFFVDSDDWLLPDCLQQLMEFMAAGQSDVAMCRLERTDGKGYSAGLSEPEWARTWQKKEALEYIDRQLSGLMSVACGKLLKRNLFQNIRFPVGRYHEDEFTTYRLLFNAERIGVMNRFLYMHRIRENSITQSRLSVTRAKDAVEAWMERGMFFQSQGMGSLALSSFSYANHLMRVYSERLKGNMTDSEIQTWQELKQAWAAAVRTLPPTIRFRLAAGRLRRYISK